MSVAATRRTFAVSDVSPATRPLAEVPYREAVKDFLGGPVEAWSSSSRTLIAGNRSHPLVGALHDAFSSHRPVSLSPDIIWLTICQGLAHHVNANAENLRHRFVTHEGTLTLRVRRDDFVKGSPENDWPGVFAEFSAAIREHLGDAHRLIVADFSTTGPVERAASEVVLLDATQAFFSYEVHTICGIPSVTLEGTPQDWRTIARRVQEFRAFDLDWWIDPLQDVCEQFVRAAEGTIDRGFWESIYKWNGPEGSGSPYLSGWVLRLFPYLANPVARRGLSRGTPGPGPFLHRNPWLVRPVDLSVITKYWDPRGPGRDDLPCLPARAPFKWLYLGSQCEMEFVAGLVGVRQDPTTLCLRPEVGWAVRHALPNLGTRLTAAVRSWGRRG
jgi:hypothetical protein